MGDGADVIALIEHLGLEAVDLMGFLAGVGDYLIEETVVNFPKNWPVPDSVPRPITTKIWAEEGARILEHGEIVRGQLASASLIAARVTGADPKAPAAVIRGEVAPHHDSGGAPEDRCAGADLQWKGGCRQSKNRRPAQRDFYGARRGM